MTLRHMKIFQVVYTEMSITRAAQKLHLSQPGVSQAIRELEEYYQTPLFHRINRKISATEKGSQLYEYVKQINELMEETETAMKSPKAPSELHIGSSITIANIILPEAVRRLREEYENCEIRVTVRNSRQITREVIKNELDLGLVEDEIESGQLEEIPFGRDTFCFVCGSAHPLAGRKQVTAEEICAYPFLMRERGGASRDIMDSFARVKQLKYQVLWDSISNQAIIQALQRLEGISVLPLRLVEEEARAGRLSVLPYCPREFGRSFSLIYHRKKHISRPMESLITYLQNKSAAFQIDP